MLYFRSVLYSMLYLIIKSMFYFIIILLCVVFQRSVSRRAAMEESAVSRVCVNVHHSMPATDATISSMVSLSYKISSNNSNYVIIINNNLIIIIMIK